VNYNIFVNSIYFHAMSTFSLIFGTLIIFRSDQASLMSSKRRLPLQQHQHLPPLGPGLLQHPDPFGHGPGIRPPPGPFPYDLERKLDLQHVEIKKLAIENQRLADSHHSLRRELAVAQHELQIIQVREGRTFICVFLVWSFDDYQIGSV
jgi:hypothetical protein